MEEQKKEEMEFDPEEALEELFKGYSRYFKEQKYKMPTSRYEAWLFTNSLSNLIVVKKVKELVSKIDEFFQIQARFNIINDDKKGINPQQPDAPVRKRREVK